jgi:selenophosphate synthetase-related protein
VFAERGLACEACGAFVEGRALRLAAGSCSVEVWDLMRDPLTRATAG